ncbi:MAG TPA: hypothetical protein VLJ42_10470 [Solirubrobacteraceae bacterium]|nr:hypothetical protein [Solirubrobacteraceae bacterium]
MTLTVEQHAAELAEQARADVARVGYAPARARVLRPGQVLLVACDVQPPPADEDARGDWYIDQLETRQRIALQVAGVETRPGDVVIMLAMARGDGDAFAPYVTITVTDIVSDGLAVGRPWSVRLRMVLNEDSETFRLLEPECIAIPQPESEQAGRLN